MAAEDDLLLSDVWCDRAAAACQLRARLRVPADHAILAGHFPGAPLVPGVLLLEAVRRACEGALALRLQFAEVADVRFSRPVAAEESVLLTAQIVAEGASWYVDGEWCGAAGRIATFRLRLVPGGA